MHITCLKNKRCSECGATNFWFGQGNLLENPPGAETRLRRTPRKTVRATGVEKHQLCVSSKWNVRAGNLAERHFDLILRKPFSGNNLVFELSKKDSTLLTFASSHA
jgi:hypothetical protein